jgi:hypothetical protein
MTKKTSVRYQPIRPGLASPAACRLILLQGCLACLPVAARDLDPALVGRWPSFGGAEINAVVVEGDHAYCGTSKGLLIFDTRHLSEDPLNPQPVGSYETSSGIGHLAIAGDYVYGASLFSLLVIDVSDPARPREVGRYDRGAGAIIRLFVAGHHAYLAASDLDVIDVSNPTRPRRVGGHGVIRRENYWDVFVQGGHAYVTNQGSQPSLLVLDVGDPANPQTVGAVGIQDIGSARRVQVSGNLAFVGSEHLGVVAVDVMDPANPRPLGSFGPPGFTGGAFLLSGRSLFVGGLVLDVTDPGAIRPLASLETFLPSRGGEPRFTFLRDLFVQDGRAYAAGPWGFQVFDVSGLAARERVGWSGGGAQTVFVQGSYAYVGWGGALEVIDVSEPASPRRVGALTAFPAVEGSTASPEDIFVSGNHAYVAGHNGGLRVVDVSTPAAPRHAGALLTASRAMGVFVAGNHAYVATDFGLVVVEVTDPADPRALVGPLDVGFRLQEVFIAGRFAYVAANGYLRVLDVGDPRQPQVLGSYSHESGSGGQADSGGLFVSGSLAYVADGITGLLVIDVSDPASPRLAGALSTSRGSANDVFVAADRAYVADGDRGVEVIDVSDPAAPRLVHGYPSFGWSAGIFVSDSLAYVAEGSGLAVIDTRIPPTLVLPAGRLETSVAVSGVAVAGDRAYVVDAGAGLHVLDVTDPANPRRVGRHRRKLREPSVEISNRVFVSGDQACILDHLSEDSTVLEVFDVSDPADPRSIGRYDAGIRAEHSFASGAYAYLVHGHLDARGQFETRVPVIDVRDPTSPRLAGTYVTSGFPSGIFVAGIHAYLGVDEGYELLDVSDPASPRLLRQFRDRGGVPLVSGDRAYVGYATAERRGFEILDVADPLNPLPLGRHLGTGVPAFVSGDHAYTRGDRNLSEFGFHMIEVRDPSRPELVGRRLARSPLSDLKFVAGGYAYAAAPGGLEVIDVGHPANPQRIGRYDDLSGTAEHGGIALSGSLAFVADGTSGLHVLDLSDPSGPRRIGGHDTSDIAEGVFVSGRHACVADGWAGIHLLEVSDPAKPRLEGTHDTSGYAYEAIVSGDHAYVADFTSGLQVVEVTDPARPRRIGGVEAGFGHGEGYALDVALWGDHAYVAGLALRVIDVSDPANPLLVGESAPAFAESVVVSDGLAYLAGLLEGLRIFDVSDPRAPVEVGSYALDSAVSVHVAGDYAYVTDGLAGLEVIEVINPKAPRRIGGNSALAGSALAVRDDRVFVAGGQSFSVLELWRPFPPASVAAMRGDGEVELSWTAPRGGRAPASYDVYRVSPGARTRLNARPVEGTSFTAAGLENGVEHCFAVRAVSASGESSEDSAPPVCATPGAPPARFRRGDCDGDGEVTGQVTDAVFLLNWSFLAGPEPPCLAACDANGDGRVGGQVTDAVFLLNYNFLGGPAPAPPFPDCGPGRLEADERLGCESPPAACE